MNQLPVVILGGGNGSRLNENPDLRPKILTALNGIPFLKWKIDELSAQGVTQIYLMLGRGANEVVKFLDKQKFKDVKITCLFDGKRLLGTGGCLVRARDLLPGRFILTFGDNLLSEPLSNFSPPKLSNVNNLIVITKFVGSADKKNISIEGPYVSQYSKIDFRSATHTDYGYAVMNIEELEKYDPNKELDLSVIWQNLISERGLFYHETNQRYFEIGTPQSLKETEAMIKKYKEL